MTPSTVHIVHCIDTEGPLRVSLAKTFEHLRWLFGIELDPTPETLARLQRSEIDLGGIEQEVAVAIAPERINYNSSWDEIDDMLRELTSADFRNSFPDSFGGGWIYNWHCVDHVGFDRNPNERELGFHKIFDHYRDVVSADGPAGDAVHFHHHPVPFNADASHNATHYFAHKPVIFEILARRIIDRNWFPCVNRPGFHAERPDSHWFFEQFIPFDIANQAGERDFDAQHDVASGRWGDWRRAPKEWRPYHPAHDDYQSEGNCRRWIARCRNLDSRYNLLTEADIDQAFAEAAKGRPVVLAMTDHDHRDIRLDVDRARGMLKKVAARYGDVPFRYCEARDAMRRALDIDAGEPIRLEIGRENRIIRISASRPTFGPQPFLAIKTRDGRYLHDNLDLQVPFREWTYVLDENTVVLDDVEALGVGTCDSSGNVTVAVMDAGTGTTAATTY